MEDTFMASDCRPEIEDRDNYATYGNCAGSQLDAKKAAEFIERVGTKLVELLQDAPISRQ
jgi:hypothetical protein